MLALRRFVVSHQGWIYFITGIISGGLGVYIGDLVAVRYAVLGQGYLAVCVIYLLARLYLAPGKAPEAPIRAAFQLHAILEYMLFAFVLGLTVTLAAEQAAAAIRAMITWISTGISP